MPVYRLQDRKMGDSRATMVYPVVKEREMIDMLRVQEFIGSVLYRIGFEPRWSTGIDGGYTAGFGKLDANGYWQFPTYQAVKDNEHAYYEDEHK